MENNQSKVDMSSPYDINILKKVDFANLFTHKKKKYAFTVVRHVLVEFGFLCPLAKIWTAARFP